MTDHRAHQYSVEPDKAAEMLVNLVRLKRNFAVEMEDYKTAAAGHSLHDVICIAVGAQLVKRHDTHLYAEDMVHKTRDDATWFALALLRDRICFSVKVTVYPREMGRPDEWAFTAERAKRRGLDHDVRKQMADHGVVVNANGERVGG